MALYTVGVIGATHGLRGEVRVLSRTDFPELRFAPGSRLLLVDAARDAVLREVTVQAARRQKGVYIVAFGEVDSIGDAAALRGLHLKVDESQLAPLAEGEHFIHELVGCDVYTDEGERLGELTQVLAPGANDVYVVRTAAGRDVLLPAIRECILGIDVAGRRVNVHMMPGLLD